MLKIKYTCFWPGFNPHDFFINNMIDNNYIIVNDESYDIIIMSVFNYYNLKVKNNSKKILFNGEHPSYIDKFINNTGIKLDLIIGFINNKNTKIDKNTIQIYYPLWILYYNNIFSEDYFIKLNNNINKVTIKEIESKKFCCLINSHDNNNTRIPIYNSLNKIDKIDCPGKLLNNMNSIGPTEKDKINFMNKYIFNICSENSIGDNYFTEKLPQCVDAGCIPIYIGNIGSFNEKIFNKNRIIQVDNINQLENKIKKLYNNKHMLLEFYKQPIFNSSSYNNIITINKILKNIINKLTNIPNS